jgi:CRISPR/Cas system-associated endonuclease Cas3-HD
MKIKIIKKMIDYFQSDVKRINHAFKLLSFAEIISHDESLDQKTREVIIYAAILHDIGIKEAEKKYGSLAVKYQEIEGPSTAKQLLQNLK